jgi:hypothetical protein
LSDETLRENYDKGGKEGVEGAPKVDSATLFAMIFGSEKFVPLVGELKLSTQMQVKEGEEYNRKLEAFRQKKREVQCAINLVTKLQPFIDYDENEEVYVNFSFLQVSVLKRFILKIFVSSFAEEIGELSASPFGKTLLATIGLTFI